ncbi:MAG TPA: hypothetical protein VF668_05890, partial [Pyrinomonadaceae bacterium]
MRWLSSPKVRLGLLVNGLYFLSLFAASPQSDTRALGRYVRALRPGRGPAFAPLPPAAGPSKATTYRGVGTNQVEVYLTKDLTLVNKPGHSLLLSPIYTADADGGMPPDTVMLRFVSFSRAQFYDDDSPLHIIADGEYVWPETSPAGLLKSGSDPSRHSATPGGDGQVVETIGETLPYDLFVEIAGARRVILRLGPDTVELNAEQMEALRDLHRKLPQPRQTVGGAPPNFYGPPP